MDAIFESRAGKVLVIIYTLFALIMYAVSYSCGTDVCGLYIVAPIMPWAFILAEDLDVSFPWAVYPIFILLNASLSYVIGAGLEWVYGCYKDYKEDAHSNIVEGRHST